LPRPAGGGTRNDSARFIFMTKRIQALFIVCVVAGAVLMLQPVNARENVNYWYIKDFQTEIIVNADSSLLITERIVADCGNATGKHGIFRVLPSQIRTTDGKVFKTPIKLISITDFNGKPLEYSKSSDLLAHTITWKIGDPNVTVHGTNSYEIKYLVQNAIRFADATFDEFYWNLLGNFWDLEIDNFNATIFLPDQVNKADVAIDYYTGILGSKDKSLAQYKWLTAHSLQFSSTKTLKINQGITASLTFPKGIFAEYQPSVFEKYGAFSTALIPVLVFVVCLLIWKKHGKDPRAKKAIMAEYDPPQGMSPIQVGGLMANGKFGNSWLSAGLINMAVKGLLKIEEIYKKQFIGSARDYKFSKTNDLKNFESLCVTEKELYAKFFENGDEVLLSNLKNKFYLKIPVIKKVAKDDLLARGLVTNAGFKYQVGMGVAAVLTWIGATIVGTTYLPLTVALVVSGIIMLFFSVYMPKKTEAGAELEWQIKGFKLFMETAEKYRQQFYEKENIFERLLPYAMVFGITKQWIAKTRAIFGEEYFKTHQPVWFAGAALGDFNVDKFTESMSNVASAVAANVGSPSGAGGHGGAGGGGGGGGGGGW
jgi:hypothetical protein